MTDTTHHSAAVDSEVTDRPSYDDINTTAIFMVGIISAIVTILSVAVVQGMAYHWERAETQVNNARYSGQLVKPIIEAQLKDLEGGLPGTKSIQEGMQEVIARYGKK